MDAKDLLIDSDGESRIEQFKSFLGVKQQVHVCSDCNVACEESTTHDPHRAAFDGGESLSWECGSCGNHYVRNENNSIFTTDLYDRE